MTTPFADPGRRPRDQHRSASIEATIWVVVFLIALAIGFIVGLVGSLGCWENFGEHRDPCRPAQIAPTIPLSVVVAAAFRAVFVWRRRHDPDGATTGRRGSRAGDR